MARPTKKQGLYVQMIGRGTRPLPGLVDGVQAAQDRRNAIGSSRKPFCEILTFHAATGRHKLIHPVDILGGNYDDAVIERARRQIEKKGKAADVAAELVSAKDEVRRRQEAEAKRRAEIRATATYSTKHYNPFDLLDTAPQPLQPGQLGATDEQIEWLNRFGVNARGRTCREAGQLKAGVLSRIRGGLCTYKQSIWLKRFGINPESVTKDEATRILTEKFGR